MRVFVLAKRSVPLPASGAVKLPILMEVGNDKDRGNDHGRSRFVLATSSDKGHHNELGR